MGAGEEGGGGRGEGGRSINHSLQPSNDHEESWANTVSKTLNGWLKSCANEDFRLDSNEFGLICAHVKLVLNWLNFCFANLVRGIRQT